MIQYEQIKDYPHDKTPVVLTIGNFDGVHRGHQTVFRRVKELAQGKARTMALTFSNHPSEILRPTDTIPMLCTLPHRIRLIEAEGIDVLMLLRFDRQLAKHSARDFIERLRQQIPLSHLVLGHDATLGRDRQGNKQVMKSLADDWGFQVHYLDEYRFEGHPISSTLIRDCLLRGDLERVEILLGRPFSIYTTRVPGSALEWEVDNLCLPPAGKYPVKLKQGEGSISTEALIVMRNDQPHLEIDLPVDTDPIEIEFINSAAF